MQSFARPAFGRRLRSIPILVAAIAVGFAGFGCRSNDGQSGPALRVGIATSEAPLIYENAGEILGIEADLARGLGERFGRRVVFERMDEAALFGALERGEVDLVGGGLAITPERARRVRFTRPYMQSGQLALIRADDIALFGRIHTIRRPGARVGFVFGSTAERFVATDLARAESFGFDDVEEALRSLRARRIDYLLHDAPTIWRIAGDPEQHDLHGLYQPLAREELAFAVRRDDAVLASEIDAVLMAWEREGLIEATIDRWIPVRVTIR